MSREFNLFHFDRAVLPEGNHIIKVAIFIGLYPNPLISVRVLQHRYQHIQGHNVLIVIPRPTHA